jgi:hypothetical protein
MVIDTGTTKNKTGTHANNRPLMNLDCIDVSPFIADLDGFCVQ